MAFGNKRDNVCYRNGIGLLADSTALIADSLDMLADAVVYGVALYAIGKSLLHKANAARISGFFQMALGVLIIIDIVRRSIYGRNLYRD